MNLISGPEFVLDISLYRTIVMLIPYAYFYRIFKVGPRGGRNLNLLSHTARQLVSTPPGGGFNPSLGPEGGLKS